MNKESLTNNVHPDSQLLSEKKQGEELRVEFSELWHAIWGGKWLVIVMTTIFAISSIFYAISLSDEFKSTATLIPASSSSSSSLSRLAGKFGGLASLAGINLKGGGEQDKAVIAMELIKSWGFLEEFIAQNKIEVAVFAATGWDRVNNKLVIDPELYDINNSTWVREFDAASGETAAPGSWELYEVFVEMINISQDDDTGIITLTVEHYSPYLAKEWADKLVLAINQHLQKQDRKDASNSIEYLKEQIDATSISEMQTIFYQLIEEQTKNLMLAEVSKEYVFKTISPAKVAEEKSGPFRAVMVVLGTLLGGVLGVLIVLFRYFSRNTAR